jgi:hypothetical protein
LLRRRHLILTKTGPRAIETIRRGDKVYCKRDGNPTGLRYLRVVNASTG